MSSPLATSNLYVSRAENSPWPSAQRTVAVLLVLLQSATLGVFMEAPIFASSVATIGIVGWLAPRHQLLISGNTTRWFVLLGIGFATKYIFAPSEFALDISFINTALAYEIVCYCLITQVLTLFLRQYEKRLPVWFLYLAVIGFIFSADARITEPRRIIMLVVVACYILLWVNYASLTRQSAKSPSRRGWLYHGLSSLIILATIAGGTTCSVVIHQHEKHLESALAAYLALADPGNARTGFSGRGGLSDVNEWKIVNSDDISLQIQYDDVPGYLRGRVFDTFEGDRWTMTFQKRVLPPTTVQDWSEYQLTDEIWSELYPPQVSDEPKIMQIWPIDEDTAGHFFLPLETPILAARTVSVMTDGTGLPFREDEGEIMPFRAIGIGSPQQVTKIDERYRSFPEAELRLQNKIDEVFADASTPQEKIRAVTHYFQQSYEYALGTKIPRDQRHRRLACFITDMNCGHCEYFATATAIMLRMVGVPTRYVTGYVAQERNQADGTWIARRRDAHAWVEAYDAVDRKWVVVESTPEAGIPSPATKTYSDYMLISLGQRFRAFQFYLRNGKQWTVATHLIQPIVAAIALGSLIWFVMTYSKRFIKRQAAKVDYAIDAKDLVHERWQMDRFVRKLGWIREPHETVTAFAHRLHRESGANGMSEIATWYHDYSQFRFKPNKTTEAIAVLRARREQLADRITQVETKDSPAEKKKAKPQNETPLGGVRDVNNRD